MRAGAYALSLLAAPLNVHVLKGLADGPRALPDLRREAGFPPQTTMRGHLRTLAEIDVIARRGQSRFPSGQTYELSLPGQDLLAVAEALQLWLDQAPQGPVLLGSPASKSSIKALVEGWSSSLVRALAARPLSLTELDRLISGLSYPSLERRLGAMRLAGQIEASKSATRGTPYAVTPWLRQAIAPLAASSLWERTHLSGGCAPIGRIDAESVFLLAVPLLRLPVNSSGSCRLGLEMGSNGNWMLAGVMTKVDRGRVASCATRLQGTPDAWASARASGWLSALVDGDPDQVEVGGDYEFASALVDGLHGALFGAKVAGRASAQPMRLP